jgi:hypothetical protein
MARQTRSETVFLRHEARERKDVYFRINPTAIRFQQGQKGGVTETLGGFFREFMYAADKQYSGLTLPDLTIEATTGAAYRRELKVIDWVWRHQADTKADGSPADIYFFDLTEIPDYQGLGRSQPRAYLIQIQNFSWDDSVNNFGQISFNLRCKILRDLFWEIDGEMDQPGSPRLTPFSRLNSSSTLPDLTTIGRAGTVSLPGFNNGSTP